MPKAKNVEESGEVIQVETEKLQRQPIQVSYTQAKKMVKKEMTEKQAEHVRKMVEANRARWEAKKKQKEEAIKQEVQQEVERVEEKKKKNEVQEVIVLPKRVYNRKPKYVEESEEEDEEPEPVKPKKQLIKQAEKHIETIQKINTVLNTAQPQNRYLSMLRF